MPHWSCHYYRIETHSSFVVGSWSFTPSDSLWAMVVYSFLIGLSLLAIARPGMRVAAAAFSGIGHLLIGSLHVYRLFRPFRFEVFGYDWSFGASLREILAVIPFGLLCLWIASRAGAKR